MARLGVALVVAAAVAAAVVAVCLVDGAAASDANCVWDSGIGVTYDLEYLQLGASSYHVQDNKNDQWSHNYTYVFNVCGNTWEIPLTRHPNYLACVNTTGSNGDTIYGKPSPAYQIFNMGNLCHRLGSDASHMEWSFYDEYNPAAGVSLRYRGGDPCPASYGDRSLQLHFQCADDADNVYDAETVQETDLCHYEIFLKSTFGCPKSCWGQNLQLCSAHGVCGYDSDDKRAKCFCNPGYEGELCEQVATKPGVDGVAVVLVFVCIVLALVLGVLIYLWVKIKTLRLDTSAYKTLQGGPEAEGDAEL